MFALGVAFSYFGVLPFIIKNVLLFGNDQFEAYITAENYFAFFIRLIIGFGIAFELPVLCFFLGKVGLITDESLKGFFKYAVVIIFIIAAIIAPPDVISQVLLAIPLVMLYGISIVILKFVNPASKLADFSEIRVIKPRLPHIQRLQRKILKILIKRSNAPPQRPF